MFTVSCRCVLKRFKAFDISNNKYIYQNSQKYFSSFILNKSYNSNSRYTISQNYLSHNSFCSKPDVPTKTPNEPDEHVEPPKSQSEIEIDEELKDLNEKGYGYIQQKNRFDIFG